MGGTVAKRIDGVAIAITTIGGVLIYAGIKGYSALSLASNLVTGKPIATDVTMSTPLTEADPSAEAPANEPSSGEAPAGGGGNQAIGQRMAAAYGWDSGVQWDSLVKLWTRESGWNNHAENKSSGAYGIPQSLPYSKMPKLAWPERYGGTSDAGSQIQWGLQYIKSRYGSPQMAWAHETSNGWY
jgi:hypothetical protein